jgi:6-phosphofructokinase 1
MTPIIESLGEGRYQSPLRHFGPGLAEFKSDADRILCDDRTSTCLEKPVASRSTEEFEIAGPRERIFFDPAKTVAAILTCGGLSPGLNDVIRSIVMELWHGYKIAEIFGIRFTVSGAWPLREVTLL